MVTLDDLKKSLRVMAKEISPNLIRDLSEPEYNAGFDILLQGSKFTYQEFIIPRLARLFDFRANISVLEIGPGPRSVLEYLPDHTRRNIEKYVAIEPNHLFAAKLDEWLNPTSGTESPLPCLEQRPVIHQVPFTPDSNSCISNDEIFDIILFCHSMYGMKPKRRFIEKALEMLSEFPESGTVVVFHRDKDLHFDGLVSNQVVSFPNGTVRVAADDNTLDRFASFVAGFTFQDDKTDNVILSKWRKQCRELGPREQTSPDHLSFNSPEAMMTFTRDATKLPDLLAQVPLPSEGRKIKNHQARVYRPASILRPTQVEHIQKCVQWALKNNLSLTVISGSHSRQCIQPNVVSVDMSAFNEINIIATETRGPLAAVGSGCNTGDIIQKTMAVGLTVPLGSRPSVGSGLWLQGGIGHLSRLHGLACDAIVGAVVVSVASGQIYHVGCVPRQHRPIGSVRPAMEDDMLWALRGAGTNFGIVVSVVFKTYAAPMYSIRNWKIPLTSNHDTHLKLQEFDQFAKALDRDCSADAYLYSENGHSYLGVTFIDTAGTNLSSQVPQPPHTMLGPESSLKIVDGTGLFDTEMYMSEMHNGGHGGGKTVSFKRCLFLKHIGTANIASLLTRAIDIRPSPFCYLHLLQGGGSIHDVAEEATAFGCRDWDFACVITAVWPRGQTTTGVDYTAQQWVYDVVQDLLPLSTGAYCADLGPDPRDAVLAARAFGSNRPRLMQLKRNLDPRNVLAYACPLQDVPKKTKLIILVTGESGAGKDYCADTWSSILAGSTKGLLEVSKVSISDAVKREYAASTGTDLERLLSDRAYKEQHRPALTAFFEDRKRKQPRLLEKQFLSVVSSSAGADVLFITGMRDEAPVATLSHLVPGARLLDVHVMASEETRQIRRRCHVGNQEAHDGEKSSDPRSDSATKEYRPSIVFDNNSGGNESIVNFTDRYLQPFLYEDLEKLASMVLRVPNFPRPGIEFRHILNIVQQKGGLSLCTSLLQSHFANDWGKVDAVVSCEVGGFVYASALAQRVDVPLVLIREAHKLPPPTLSVDKLASHISSSEPHGDKGNRIAMGQGLIASGASVVVVDDVLATGKTLCAVLQLLMKGGTVLGNISIMVVAEFPVHKGRELLYRHGFGGVGIQSLLVFDGV